MRRSTQFAPFGTPTEEPPRYEALGAARVVSHANGTVRLRSGTTLVEVTALAPDLFRVGMFGEGRPADYRSEAVLRSDWPTPTTRFSQAPTSATLELGSFVAEISLDPLRMSFRDGQRVISVDDPTLGMGFLPLAPAAARLVDPLGAPAVVFKRHEPGTRYFGCGERTGGLDKTGSRQVFWNVDPPIGHTASLNNLYTSVPFVLALRDGQAWGMFVDSGYRLEFDLAARDPTRCAFGVDGGPLIYYVFSGPTPARVLERYTELTGRIPLPPRWALGNHQSRWGYRSADEVLRVARTFRERNLPLDALYLDIDYMRGYRVFTWDAERFPDPAGLVRELAGLGVKLVTIVDPGVKVDEDDAVYTRGRQADLGNVHPRHAAPAPTAPAVPVYVVRRGAADWGSDPTAAAVRVSGRPDNVLDRRRAPARFGAAGGADHPTGRRASPRLSPSRHLGALLERPPIRWTRPPAGARARGSAGDVRAREHARPVVARYSRRRR
jgi:alpha-glucosidase